MFLGMILPRWDKLSASGTSAFDHETLGSFARVAWFIRKGRAQHSTHIQYTDIQSRSPEEHSQVQRNKINISTLAA